MAQQTLNDGVSFGEQRSKINSNFTELYSTKTNMSDITTTVAAHAGAADPHGVTYPITPGGYAVDITGSDLNSLHRTGFFRGRSLVNAPLGNGGWWYVQGQSHTADWIKQTATAFGSDNNPGDIYERVCFGIALGSVWTAWAKVFKQGTAIDGTPIGQTTPDAGAFTTLSASGLSVTGTLSVASNNFRVASNGNVTNLNNSYGAISDIKLKQDIEDCSPKLAKLNQVRIVNYRLKSDPEFKQLGVIAQELEQIFPGLVEETEDYKEVIKTREVPVPAVTEEQLVTEAVFNDEGEEIEPAVYETVEITPATTKTEEYTERVATGEFTKSVKYSVFVPMLIKAVQEQIAIITSMEARIDALETA